MKRTISALAMLALLTAAPVFAQTPADTTTTPPPAYQDQTTTSTDASTSTQATTTTDATSDNLPSTAGPLPLMAAAGFATLGAGAWVQRRRRSR